MKTQSATKPILFTFAFSWALFLIVILSGLPRTTFPNMALYILGGSGPTLVALAFVWRTYGADARRDFWARVFEGRRIGGVWWLLSLLAIPLLMVLAVVLDGLLGGARPAMTYLQQLIADPVSIVPFLIIMLVGGPISEELGWRGIVLESFQRRWTPLRSTLVLSAIWWAWHLPLFYIPGTTQYEWGLFTPMFWLFAANVLLLTILMTLSYNHNGRSILVAILIHFSYNLPLSLLFPFSTRTFALMTLLLAILVAATLKTVGWNSSAEPGLR